MLKFETITHPVTGLTQKWPVGKTGKPKLVLSGSNQGNENACSNLFRFNRMFQNPRWPDGHAAACGTALHEAYQKFLIEDAQGTPRAEAFDLATFELMKWYPMGSDHQKNAANRQFEHCYATLSAACSNTKYPSDYARPELLFIERKDGTVQPAVELNFEIFIEQNIIPDFDVYISGALDLVRYSTGGLYDYPFVEDIKTTREWGLYDERYGNANQCLPYHILLSHIMGEEITTFTVVYNIMYIHLLEPKIIPIAFHKTKDDIDEYLKSFVLLLQKLQNQIAMNHWPKNSNSCTRFNTPCQYMQACAIKRGEDAYVQDVLLGEAEPYDRYNTSERPVDFELELTL